MDDGDNYEPKEHIALCSSCNNNPIIYNGLCRGCYLESIKKITELEHIHKLSIFETRKYDISKMTETDLLKIEPKNIDYGLERVGFNKPYIVVHTRF